jgi:small subunit ribosomal protein S7
VHKSFLKNIANIANPLSTMLSPLRHGLRLPAAVFMRLGTAPKVQFSASGTLTLHSETDYSAPQAPAFPNRRALEETPLDVDSARPALVDIPLEQDPLLHYMSSCIMKHGKRKQADRTISRMLLYIHSLARAPPLDIVREAVLRASPFARTRSLRHSAKTLHYPVALSEKQRTRYAIKWILEASDKRLGQTLEERLARELIAIVSEKEGDTDGRGDKNEVLLKKRKLHEFVMVNRYVLCSLDSIHL